MQRYCRLQHCCTHNSPAEATQPVSGGGEAECSMTDISSLHYESRGPDSDSAGGGGGGGGEGRGGGGGNE